MTIRKRFGLIFVALVALAFVAELAAPLAGLHSGPIGAAEARVGRPLTPVSVAGAGRRTVRRCAAGVYNC